MGYLNQKPTAVRAGSSTYTTGLGVLLTGTTINTKLSSYNEVLTATDSPIDYLTVDLQPGGVVNAQALVDIAVGPGGQEHILVSNIGVNSGTGFAAAHIPLPMTVPAGTRISARYQRSNASLTMRVGVRGFSQGAGIGRSHCVTYGATTATSRGTSIDPGGSANTKGSWVQLSAATTHPIRWMLLHLGNQANSARTDATYVVDIGVGAAASESVIVANLMFMIDDAYDEPVPAYIGPFPVSIPTGSRLAARAACTITDATDRLFDIIAYGIS